VGLTGSTVLTLLVVPVVYRLLDDLQAGLARRFPRRPLRRAAGAAAARS